MVMKKSILKIAGLAALLALALTPNVPATENVPHAPFAEWADLPLPGQLVAGLVYQESESYHIWANGGQRSDIDFIKSGEHYGIDINQGYIALQYGITRRWALDLNVGYTTFRLAGVQLQWQHAGRYQVHHRPHGLFLRRALPDFQ